MPVAKSQRSVRAERSPRKDRQTDKDSVPQSQKTELT